MKRIHRKQGSSRLAKILIGISAALFIIGSIVDFLAIWNFGYWDNDGASFGYLVTPVSMPGWFIGTLLAAAAGLQSRSGFAWAVCIASLCALISVFIFPPHMS